VKAFVTTTSAVLLSAVVGFRLVLQHTPLAMIAPPPSDVMLPPETAVVDVTEVAAVVVNVARTTGFELNGT
jgi:hypothetical protein